jgi:predicted small metal-binding protein
MQQARQNSLRSVVTDVWDHVKHRHDAMEEDMHL